MILSEDWAMVLDDTLNPQQWDLQPVKRPSLASPCILIRRRSSGLIQRSHCTIQFDSPFSAFRLSQSRTCSRIMSQDQSIGQCWKMHNLKRKRSRDSLPKGGSRLHKCGLAPSANEISYVAIDRGSRCANPTTDAIVAPNLIASTHPLCCFTPTIPK